MARTTHVSNFHGPKDVRAIEVRLYLFGRQVRHQLTEVRSIFFFMFGAFIHLLLDVLPLNCLFIRFISFRILSAIDLLPSDIIILISLKADIFTMIKHAKLRRLSTPNKCSAFYKGDNFCGFLFALLRTKFYLKNLIVCPPAPFWEPFLSF